MNPNIAKRSLEALEIFRKDGVKGFPWTPEKKGDILSKERYGFITDITTDDDEGNLFIMLDHTQAIWQNWSNCFQYYLPTDRQLDQWVIDWNAKEQNKSMDERIWFIHHKNHDNRYCLSWIIYNTKKSLDNTSSCYYTNAEEQYLAKCQVIAAAYKLTKDCK